MRRAIAACLALTLAGCSPLEIRGSRPSPLAQAAATHEYPGPRPAQPLAGTSVSAVLAIEAFATTYVNWTAHTLVAQLRGLAAVSVGQARSAMALAAQQAAGDYELQRGGVANQGRVEAVASVIGQRGEYVVVTRELTTASNTTAYQGLGPAWHLTVATVVELAPRRWVLSGWQPES